MKHWLPLLLVAVGPLLAHAQFGPMGPPIPFPPQPEPVFGRLPYEGSEIYRFMLHKQGLTPLQHFLEAIAKPKESLIIVHGENFELKARHGLFGANLREYLDNGGAILIAGDRNTDNTPGSWAQTFGIYRNGRHLTAAEEQCYRQAEGRPFIRPLNPFAPALLNKESPFRIVADIERSGKKAIATDLASAMYLQGQAPVGMTRTPLASYPISAKYLAPLAPGQEALRFEGCYFAVAFRADEGGGRMIVMADHSVFVNGMMGFVSDPAAEGGYSTDNGNFEFSRRTINWLQEGGPTKRTKCLFIEDGDVVNLFARQIETPPNNIKPPMPPLTPEMVVAVANAGLNYTNTVVQTAENNNFFNRRLQSWLGLNRWVRIFLVVVTVLFGLFLLRLFVRSYWKANPAANPSPSTLEPLLPHGGALKQRLDAQLDVNNFYEAARTRIQDRYNRLGGQPSAQGAMPPLLIADDGVNARDLSDTIRALWLIGYGTKPIHVGPREWDTMNRDLERTLKLASKGEWTFGQEMT